MLSKTVTAGYLARPGSCSVCSPPGLRQPGLSSSYTIYTVNATPGCIPGGGAGLFHLEFLPAVRHQMCKNMTQIALLFSTSCKAPLLTHSPELCWVRNMDPGIRAAVQPQHPCLRLGTQMQTHRNWVPLTKGLSQPKDERLELMKQNEP